ncbi:MAG: PAS domain S-box protein [Proteobacteria bacterium]|nr:PAS domain S-box protein [Pseudomonadota bacterium]
MNVSPYDRSGGLMTPEEQSQDAARISAELVGPGGGTDPFSAAVRATRMPMIITDPRQSDNPVVFVNDAFCRLSGYEREEIVGRNCRFLQGPETDRETVARVRAAVAEERSIEVDIRNHRKSGEPFWNRLLLAPVRDGRGELAYFFASQVDVTLERERLLGLETHNAALLAEIAGRLRAQQLSEAELRRTDRLLQSIIETANGLVYAKDRQGRMLVGNRQTLALIGKSWAEVEGRTDVEFLDDRAQAEAVMATDERIMRTGIAAEVEEQVGVEGGRPRTWLSTKAPMRDGDGVVVGMVGISQDITTRKRAQAELQALNATLEARVAERTAERDRAWKNAQDLICVADAEGVFRAVNPAWTRVLGWEAEELVGQHFLFVTHPEDAEATVAVHETALKSMVPRYEFRCRHKDGSYRWISWSATPDAGLIYGNGRDVTAERQAAAALARAEELLRQSQKMEAVGQLTGGIAHDFNNLLAAISGSLELLQRRLDSGRTEGLKRYTSAAMTAAQRAASLTQRLLAFARRQPLDPKRVEANRLVADMEDLLRRTLGPGIDLEIVFAGGLWPTLCDANQLESAILNLAINARDAMPGGGRLTIETANAFLDDAYARSQGGEVRPGQYVMISVTDTGIGMTSETMAKAFEPFFTTKPLGQGTGLGLSMLYGFVRQSEGHVRIYSEEGQGTTFRLYLPRQRGGMHMPEEAAADMCDSPDGAEAGQTVLVVDDERTVRMLVTETLEELGYAALEAAEGTAALRILESGARIDLLVTDVGLPGLNGRQLAEAARRLRPGLRVLFITGYAHNAAIGIGGLLDPGMEIITKPFALDMLATKIRSMIKTV